ncbi:MAG: cation diffusion facilitator family transporter [Nitrososphaerota archaeon]
MHNHIEKKLGLVFAISIGIFVFELVGGLLSNSLALISDSLHVLLDFSAIGISLIAFRIAKRPHSTKLSYGFHRAEIIAALINGLSLVAIATFIFYEAYRRFLEPHPIDTPLLFVFAGLGLVANLIMAFLLKKESHSNLNIRGSYVHVLGDLLSSIAVIVGAIIIQFTNYFAIDAMVSIGIGILIIRSGIILCRECFHIFMEGTPHEIKISDISEELQKFEEITDVHDLHVWTLTSNVFAMSAHVKVRQEFMAQNNTLLNKINQLLRDKFGINHCTIQIENEFDLINPDKK